MHYKFLYVSLHILFSGEKTSLEKALVVKLLDEFPLTKENLHALEDKLKSKGLVSGRQQTTFFKVISPTSESEFRKCVYCGAEKPRSANFKVHKRTCKLGQILGKFIQCDCGTLFSDNAARYKHDKFNCPLKLLIGEKAQCIDQESLPEPDVEIMEPLEQADSAIKVQTSSSSLSKLLYPMNYKAIPSENHSDSLYKTISNTSPNKIDGRTDPNSEGNTLHCNGLDEEEKLAIDVEADGSVFPSDLSTGMSIISDKYLSDGRKVKCRNKKELHTFKCPCDKTFTSLKKQLNHKKTCPLMTSSRFKKCDDCGFSTLSRHELSKHVTSNHKL